MNILKEIKFRIKIIRDYLLFIFFWIRKNNSIRKKVSKTILVIRIDAIGDGIIWLDQAKEYRKAFQGYKLVLLHNSAWSEIADRLPWFDECIPFNPAKIGDIKYYKHLLSILNKYTYEKIFSPVFSRDFITVDWIVHNVNALEKIGYKGDYQNNFRLSDNNLYYRYHSEKYNLKSLSDSWYNTLVPNKQCLEMELQRNAHFIQNTINHNFKSKLPTIPFDIPSNDKTPDTDYAVFFIGASVKEKMWPINYFIQIAPHIPYRTIVLCGAHNEQYLAKSFLSRYEGNKTVIDYTGRTTLLDLISIIAKAKIIISNDTSASHIAVATRTRSICLLGGGHYGRFHPYDVDVIDEKEKTILPIVITAHDKSCFKCNWKCKFSLQNKRWKCINNIEIDDVVLAIRRICSE